MALVCGPLTAAGFPGFNMTAISSIHYQSTKKDDASKYGRPNSWNWLEANIRTLNTDTKRRLVRTPHLIHDLEPGQTVVEFGAYLGHYTLSAAKAVGPAGRFLCWSIPITTLSCGRICVRTTPKRQRLFIVVSGTSLAPALRSDKRYKQIASCHLASAARIMRGSPG